MTLLHNDPTHTRRHIHHCRTQIDHIRFDLQQWHIHRQKRIAQEHERYAQHKLPYKAIRQLNNAMGDTGHRTITTVRLADGSLIYDPAAVLQATQNSFLHQHTPTQDTLDTDTKNKIDRRPQLFNLAQRRQLEKRPYGASSHGELGAMANVIAKIAANLPRILPHVVRVWFVVDATVNTQLLLRIRRQPLHKATTASLGTQALLHWKALRSLSLYVQLHIVKQEPNRHQYGTGKVDIKAVHQRTTHLPTLQVPILDRKHTPPEPEPHQTPD